MDRIVEISSLGVRVYGGGYDLYAERRDAEAAAATRDLETATRDAKRVEREIQATRERKDQRDAARPAGKGPGATSRRLSLTPWRARAEQTRAGQQRLADRKRAGGRGDAGRRAGARRAGAPAGVRPAVVGPGRPASWCWRSTKSRFAWPGGAPLLARGHIQDDRAPSGWRIAGRNGSGKTTLVGLATGELDPTAGRVTCGVQAVMLDQRAALLRDDESLLLENYRRLNPEADDNAAYAALARFVFRNVAALKPAAPLSGGERLRAALACVLMARAAAAADHSRRADQPPRPHSIAAIETALAAYDGALLVISHDQEFLAAVGIDETLRL